MVQKPISLKTTYMISIQKLNCGRRPPVDRHLNTVLDLSRVITPDLRMTTQPSREAVGRGADIAEGRRYPTRQQPL